MRFRTAVIWNGISQIGLSGIQFLSTIILARLLTPDDYGVIGMVTIFITLGSMMVDSEMGGALLRKENVTKLDYSTLFYYNLAVSLFIYACLFFTAPLVADFYSKPILTEVIRVIGLAIIIHAFRVVQQVMIFRNLAFKTFAIISIVSGGISLLCAIWLARHGAGYWALVWQIIIAALLNVVFLSVRNRFIPVLHFSKASFKEQFSFGISLLGSDTLKVVANNISLNIVAKFAPLNLTGNYTQYSRLTAFSQNFLGALMNQSVFPMLARVGDNTVLYKKYKKIFLYLIFVLGGVTIPLAVFSKSVVYIVLGKEWISEVWMFQVLCLTILPTAVQILCRNVLKASGDTKEVLKIETVKSITVLGLLCIAIIWGIVAIVWSVAIGQTVVTFYALSRTGVSLKHSYRIETAVFAITTLLLYSTVVLLIH